jgi:Domain of unknown function (DUF1707)
MTEQGHDRLRASHADRERAIDVLKAAFAEGRLDQDEFTDRVGQVQVSRTYADLGALIADLPVGPFGTLAPAPPAGVGAGPLPLPAPPPEESRLRPPPRTSMTPLVIAALIAGSMAPTIAIPVLAVVICINLARGGLTRERRIRLVAAGAILALVIVASMHLGL